jgi:hypothetical protein
MNGRIAARPLPTKQQSAATSVVAARVRKPRYRAV